MVEKTLMLEKFYAIYKKSRRSLNKARHPVQYLIYLIYLFLAVPSTQSAGTVVINTTVTVRSLLVNPGASIRVNAGFRLTILQYSSCNNENNSWFNKLRVNLQIKPDALRQG